MITKLGIFDGCFCAFSGSEWVPRLWFRTSITENDKLSYRWNVKFVRGSLPISLPSISLLFVSAGPSHTIAQLHRSYFIISDTYDILLKNHNIRYYRMSWPLIFVCYYTINIIHVIHCWHSASIDICSKLSTEQIYLIYYRSSIAETLAETYLKCK